MKRKPIPGNWAASKTFGRGAFSVSNFGLRSINWLFYSIIVGGESLPPALTSWGATPSSGDTPQRPEPRMPAHSRTRHQQPRRPCQIRSSHWLLPPCRSWRAKHRPSIAGRTPVAAWDAHHQRSTLRTSWGISSLPVVGVSASLALAPCGAPVSDRGMCHSAQKFKSFLACAGCARRPTSPCSLPCSADRASPPLILCFMHCGSFNPSFCFGF